MTRKQLAVKLVHIATAANLAEAKRLIESLLDDLMPAEVSK